MVVKSHSVLFATIRDFDLPFERCADEPHRIRDGPSSRVSQLVVFTPSAVAGIETTANDA